MLHREHSAIAVPTFIVSVSTSASVGQVLGYVGDSLSVDEPRDLRHEAVVELFEHALCQNGPAVGLSEEDRHRGRRSQHRNVGVENRPVDGSVRRRDKWERSAQCRNISDGGSSGVRDDRRPAGSADDDA